MKFTFEMYEFGNRGRVFLGFKNITANSQEEAVDLANTNLPENVKLAQIWVPQENN